MKLPVLILVLASALSAQQIDRIVAVVNRQPIVESEWEQQERFEALANEGSVTGFTQSRGALERVIDRRLILQQMDAARVTRSDASSARAQVMEFRKQLHLESDQQWEQRLARYGLLESDVADVLGEQADVLRFIDARFLMTVHVTPDEVRQYYSNTYLADVQRAGKAVQPLATVQQQIQSVLEQQRLNELITAWLKNLRTQATIRFVVRNGAE